MYLLLIVGFTFFYTYATFNPAEVSTNIKQNGENRMPKKQKKFADDGWAIWVDGDDMSTVYINNWLNPKNRSYVDLAVRIRGVKASRFLYVYVPFTTLLLGGQMEVPTLKGTTTIDIKPLTQSNTKYTLKGKGIKFLRGFGSGDLVVTLKGEMPKNLDKGAKKLVKELENAISAKDYPKTETYNKKLK